MRANEGESTETHPWASTIVGFLTNRRQAILCPVNDAAEIQSLALLLCLPALHQPKPARDAAEVALHDADLSPRACAECWCDRCGRQQWPGEAAGQTGGSRSTAAAAAPCSDESCPKDLH